jgi:integrator complex subunit 9
MMEDLVSMHAEFRQFYGPEDSSFPPWLRQEQLEILPSVLKEILLGKDGVESGGWMPLYR